MSDSKIVYLQSFVNTSPDVLLEQTNRRALATNEWLRVRECEGVYAIGDCATVSQRKIMVCVRPIVLNFQLDR
jgi:NADH dehydrogenase FAD-containing subunit